MTASMFTLISMGSSAKMTSWPRLLPGSVRRGLAGEVALVGIDGQRSVVEEIAAGGIDGTVIQYPDMALEAVEEICRYLDGEPLSFSNYQQTDTHAGKRPVVSGPGSSLVEPFQDEVLPAGPWKISYHLPDQIERRITMKKLTAILLTGAIAASLSACSTQAEEPASLGMDLSQYTVVDISHLQEADMPADPALQLPQSDFFGRIGVDGGLHNLEVLSYCVHTGTHMDAPYHVIETGGGIDTVDPSF